MCSEDCIRTQRVTAHKADGAEKAVSGAEKTDLNLSQQVQILVRDADRKLRREIAGVKGGQEANQEAGEAGVQIEPGNQQGVPQQHCEGGEQTERGGGE